MLIYLISDSVTLKEKKKSIESNFAVENGTNCCQIPALLTRSCIMF